jgi:predicted RNA-binding protein
MLDAWFTDVPHNADFYSHANLVFFQTVQTRFDFLTPKPLVFVPCASTKPISKSRTHCYLSPITRNPALEICIISEPQGVVPYALEHLMPNYDYPPGNLTAQDRWQLVRRVGFFLEALKAADPSRTVVYYIGGRHHAEVLRDANAINFPFHVVTHIPARGIRDYTETARTFAAAILGGKV